MPPPIADTTEVRGKNEEAHMCAILHPLLLLSSLPSTLEDNNIPVVVPLPSTLLYYQQTMGNDNEHNFFDYKTHQILFLSIPDCHSGLVSPAEFQCNSNSGLAFPQNGHLTVAGTTAKNPFPQNNRNGPDSSGFL